MWSICCIVLKKCFSYSSILILILLIFTLSLGLHPLFQDDLTSPELSYQTSAGQSGKMVFSSAPITVIHLTCSLKCLIYPPLLFAVSTECKPASFCPEVSIFARLKIKRQFVICLFHSHHMHFFITAYNRHTGNLHLLYIYFLYQLYFCLIYNSNGFEYIQHRSEFLLFCSDS